MRWNASQPVHSRTAAPSGTRPCSASQSVTSAARSVQSGSLGAERAGVDPHRGADEPLGGEVAGGRAAGHRVDRGVEMRAGVLGCVQVARPEAVGVVAVLRGGGERDRPGPEDRVLVERLREVEDPHGLSSNGRSNSVERTIWVCVRVTPACARIRSSASSRCVVSRARTWTIALASPAVV